MITLDQLPPLALPPAAPPKAAREQLDMQPWEAHLVALARLRHPTVAWWHGYRDRTAHGFGSWCYVCDRMVVTWSRRWPITETARRAVHEHKNWHRLHPQTSQSDGPTGQNTGGSNGK
jgi:hypothetical protein